MTPARLLLSFRNRLSARFFAASPRKQNALLHATAFVAVLAVTLLAADPAQAQNLESFAQNVRGILSSTLLRTLAVIAVIVTGLLWFLGRASTQVLVTVIVGIAIVFSADAIVGAIAG